MPWGIPENSLLRLSPGVWNSRLPEINVNVSHVRWGICVSKMQFADADLYLFQMELIRFMYNQETLWLHFCPP